MLQVARSSPPMSLASAAGIAVVSILPWRDSGDRLKSCCREALFSAMPRRATGSKLSLTDAVLHAERPANGSASGAGCGGRAGMPRAGVRQTARGRRSDGDGPDTSHSAAGAVIGSLEFVPTGSRDKRADPRGAEHVKWGFEDLRRRALREEPAARVCSGAAEGQ